MAKIVAGATAHIWLQLCRGSYDIRPNEEFSLLFVELSAKDEMLEGILRLVHCCLAIMHLVNGFDLLTTTVQAWITSTCCCAATKALFWTFMIITATRTFPAHLQEEEACSPLGFAVVEADFWGNWVDTLVLLAVLVRVCIHEATHEPEACLRPFCFSTGTHLNCGLKMMGPLIDVSRYKSIIFLLANVHTEIVPELLCPPSQERCLF
jgi:hypothetical protein